MLGFAGEAEGFQSGDDGLGRAYPIHRRTAALEGRYLVRVNHSERKFSGGEQLHDDAFTVAKGRLLGGELAHEVAAFLVAEILHEPGVPESSAVGQAEAAFPARVEDVFPV